MKTLVIHGKIPSGNRRAIGKKNGKPFIFKTQQKEIKQVINQIKSQWNLPTIKSNVEIFYTFYFPDKKKRDIDNRLKILNDCLEEAGVIADDNLITDGHFKKRISKEKGHLTIIQIKELEDG